MKKYPTIITGALLPIYIFLLTVLEDFLPYETPSEIIMFILCAISGVATTLCLTKNNLLDFCISLILLILAIVISFIIYIVTGIFGLIVGNIEFLGLSLIVIILWCLIFCAIGSIVAGGISLYRQLTTKKHEQ